MHILNRKTCFIDLYMKFNNPKILRVLKWIFLLLIYPFIFLFILFNIFTFIFNFDGYSYGIKYDVTIPEMKNGLKGSGWCETSKSKNNNYFNKFCNQGKDFWQIKAEEEEKQLEEEEKQLDLYDNPSPQ
jgi:hypothetical protein